MKTSIMNFASTKTLLIALLSGSPRTGIVQAWKSCWSRLIAWARALQADPDMTIEWSCCGTPMLGSVKAVMGRHETSLLAISSCSHCGARWLRSFSTGGPETRWQPIDRLHAEALLDTLPGPARDALLAEVTQLRVG